VTPELAPASAATTGRPRAVRLLGAAIAIAAYATPSVRYVFGRVRPYDSAGTAWLATVAALITFFLLLPYVSYRRRDIWIFILVPVYPIYLAAKIGWRAANLPTRDWPPRPDETRS
jgi:hypothetical protein